MRLRSVRPLLAGVALLAAAGCTRRIETRSPVEKPPVVAPDRTLRFDPIEIVGSPSPTPLDELNAEELFAIGVAAMEGGDNVKALQHFERLADFHTDSPHRPEALHRAGLMLERMRDFPGAVSRFLEAARAFGDTPVGAESVFKAADAYYFLGDYDAAAATLEPLSWAPWVPPVRRAEADVKRGVVLLAGGRLDDAEKLLRSTLHRLRDDLNEQLPDAYLPSQAQFHLAEVYRSHFLLVELDPSRRTQEQLLQDLEYKAQMLLSAQGHYLRCIRLGHPEWATASGFRIGELYQRLYEQLVDSRVPSDLDAEQAEVYREELRGRVRVLVSKAIDAYEKTLSTAERVGATNPFVQETRLQLERMKSLLLEEAEVDTHVGG